MADLETALRHYGRTADELTPPLTIGDLERELATRGIRGTGFDERAIAELAELPETEIERDRRGGAGVQNSGSDGWRSLALVSTAVAVVLALLLVVSRRDDSTVTTSDAEMSPTSDALASPSPLQFPDSASNAQESVDDAPTADGPRPVIPSEATGGTPVPIFEDAVLADDGLPPLPLGEVTSLPDNHRLDFLFEFCFDTCFRDAHFMAPEDPDFGSGPWPAGKPFHVRHGFVNDSAEPLGEGYDVVLYATPLDQPGEFGGEIVGQTLRYSSDYVIRSESSACGPTYKEQTEPVTCESFVHDFPEGLTEGRWAIWAVWEAPCAAWVELGLAADCTDPAEVRSHFSSGVDSPFDSFYSPEFQEQNMAQMSLEEIERLFGPSEPPVDAESEPVFEPGPEVLPDASGVAATGGTPLPDLAGAVVGDDGAERLPLGSTVALTYEDRLDFLDDRHGFRDAKFVNPNDLTLTSSAWAPGRPFVVRHGFVNEGAEPLGDEFDVVLYVYEWDDFGAPGVTQRFSSDYVLRGETDRCGPTYRSHEEPVTCEWFVHEFHEGLPEGRHALWAFWEAPCSAWIEYGFVEVCEDPTAVISLFSSGVDSPWIGGEVIWDSE